jgi:hypothetical protein
MRNEVKRLEAQVEDHKEKMGTQPPPTKEKEDVNSEDETDDDVSELLL